MEAGLAFELVHKEKHADASSVRRSLYLSERVFYVFVFRLSSREVTHFFAIKRPLVHNKQ